MKKKAPNPADVFAGTRLKTRRLMLGKSQADIGRVLGVTHQQAAKIERGVNRISTGRLIQLAKYLDVPVSYFFEDSPEYGASITMAKLSEDVHAVTEFTTSRDGLSIIRAFHKMTPKARHAFAAAFTDMADE